MKCAHCIAYIIARLSKRVGENVFISCYVFVKSNFINQDFVKSFSTLSVIARPVCSRINEKHD